MEVGKEEGGGGVEQREVEREMSGWGGGGRAVHWLRLAGGKMSRDGPAVCGRRCEVCGSGRGGAGQGKNWSPTRRGRKIRYTSFGMLRRKSRISSRVFPSLKGMMPEGGRGEEVEEEVSLRYDRSFLWSDRGSGVGGRGGG